MTRKELITAEEEENRRCAYRHEWLLPRKGEPQMTQMTQIMPWPRWWAQMCHAAL